MNYILNDLFTMQDLKYKEFQASLIPNIDKEKIIGVRIPQLRKYLTTLTKEQKDCFIQTFNHYYYDESLLHMLILSKEKNLSFLYNLDQFLPYVDNWAVCDVQTPLFLYNDLDLTKEYVHKWINSNHPYQIRFAIKVVMTIFLDLDPSSSLELVAKIKHDNYYVLMMKAWFFQVALVKHYDKAIIYLEKHLLDQWTLNKTISKCIDSYLISNETKQYLKTLRQK